MNKKCFPNNKGATSTPNARDLASRAQSPDRAPEVSTSFREEYKAGNNDSGSRRKKCLKIFAASTLALIMGIGTLCGVLLAPMHSAQVSTSGATASSNSANLAGAAQLGDSAKEEWAENILSGDLNLDPENDPVIGTTENGLEIKFHGVALTGEWDYTKFTTDYVTDTFTGSGTFYNLSGYLYITMGTYGGSAVNWIIIGRNSSLNAISATNTYAQCATTVTNFLKFSSYSTYANYLNSQRETSTPAGSAISSDNSKQIVNTVSGISRSYTYNLSSYGAPVATTEIPSGCVLCLCSKILYTSEFNPYNSEDNDYSGSTLQTQMTNLYSSGLGLTSAQKAKIQAQTLSTVCAYNLTSISGQYLFPLAATIDGRSQNFCVETYLGQPLRDADDFWWLRSGYWYISQSEYAYGVYDNGYVSGYSDYYNGVSVSYTGGVRPAFVLKIV